MSELKIISWNVNGIRTRIKNKDVDPVLEKDADILLFQETKQNMKRWIRSSWKNADMNTIS